MPVAIFINTGLIKTFGGAGLVPAAGITLNCLLAVGLGAGGTVLLATRLGIPISTTHALTGALVGAGMMSVGVQQLGWPVLVQKFVQPLLLSPLVAAIAAALLFFLLRAGRRALGVETGLCLCVDQQVQRVVTRNGVLMLAATGATLTVDDASRCETRYWGKIFAIPAERIYKNGQLLTGGLISFARGLNDTPKIAGILVAGAALGWSSQTGLSGLQQMGSLAAVAFAMLAGGWLGARRVGETMAEKITDLDGEQGLAAGLVAATLVLLASFFALPVSTTHVTCGALFGIGATTGKAQWKMIGAILLAWVTTLPLAAFLSACLWAIQT